MKHLFKLIASTLTLMLLPVTGYSHTGMESLTEMMGLQALLAGVLHPLFGLDHLLVMLAIGFWAGLLQGKVLWLLPSSFLLMMMLGAGLQLAGNTLIAAEVWVALSVLACGAGLFWAHRQNLASLLVALSTSLLAVSHGYVHAAEALADLPSYACGFLLSTALLHVIGILLCSASGSELDNIRKNFAIVCTLAGTALLIAM